MSENELRDRIAEAFVRGADGYGGIKGGAQAIIDDLGLEWELRLRTWDDMDGESRVVGKWGQA